MICVHRSENRLKILLFLLGIALGFAFSRILVPNNKPDNSLSVNQNRLQTDLNKYYPKHFSRGNEEIIIRHLLNDRRDGFFLDVGAYHYKNESNTFFLEKYLGWEGIAIDANRSFEEGYKKNRLNTKFFNCFISDKSDELINFFIVRDPQQLVKSSGVIDFVSGHKTEKIQVPTITLNDLLASLKVDRIDFMNMDIELSEPRALAGFDIEKYRPELVCIEAHRQVRAPILSYFKAHGYVRLDTYFLFDQKNWYFVPEARFDEIFDVDF